MKKSMVCAAVAATLACATFASCSKKDIAKQCEMVKIPGRNFELMNTEVTQKFYKEVMGELPDLLTGLTREGGLREEIGDDIPVFNICWYDAICFCNKMSEKYGYEPVYSVNGTTDVSEWGWTLYNIDGKELSLKVVWNKKANGFRLPTNEEWEYAAIAGENFLYPGSDDISKVAWINDNSEGKMHPVAKKKPNAFGLFDMLGNVDEPVWWDDLGVVIACTRIGEYQCVRRGRNFETPGYAIKKGEWKKIDGDAVGFNYLGVDTNGLRLARTVMEN